MRIALLPDEYLPLGTRAHAKMIHELALELKRKNHDIVVITPGEPSQSSSLVVDYINDIEVWRFRSGHTRGVGMFKRAVNEWLLSYRAWQAIKENSCDLRFDLCINYSPTIFFGPLTKKLKKNGSYVYLILRDIFPQWIIDQGLIGENSLAAYFFRYYEKLNYRTADFIGVQSEANLKLFKKNFPEFKNVEILMNWSSILVFKNSEKKFSARESFKLSDSVIFFYGGNIGHAQDMTNIMRLARNLKNHHKAHILIVGQGDEFDLIKRKKRDWELDNVTILPSVDQTMFQEILAEVDVGLFSLSKKHTAHNYPGKILGYMVQSLPILGSVNDGNDLLTLINESKAGFVYKNGQDDLLLDAAIKLLDNKKIRESRGINAHQLFKRSFSVEMAAKSILRANQLRG